MASYIRVTKSLWRLMAPELKAGSKTKDRQLGDMSDVLSVVGLPRYNDQSLQQC